VKAFLAQLPEAVKIARGRRGLEQWDKAARPFIDYEPADRAGQVYQIDHTLLNIMIRVEVGPGVWEARSVWLTVVLDVFSRCVPAFVLSTRVPDAWTTALVLRRAIGLATDPRFAGIPDVLVPDHGTDFMSHAVASLLRALGIRLDPTPPYYPNMKAEVERFFGTIKLMLREIVGVIARGARRDIAAHRIPMLLRREDLVSEIERFLRDYHTRPHAGLDGDTPIARWDQSIDDGPTRRLPPDDELNLLMLKDDVSRVVGREGIHVRFRDTALGQRGGRYWAPELMDYFRQRVVVRYNPEDLESILVYDAATQAFLCEAWSVGFAGARYSAEAIKQFRIGFRRDLKARTRDYLTEVEHDDRRSARARDQQRAHVLAVAGRALSFEPTVSAATSTSGTGLATDPSRCGDTRPLDPRAATSSGTACVAAVGARVLEWRARDRNSA